MRTIHIEIPDSVIYAFKAVIWLCVLIAVVYVGIKTYGMYTQYTDAMQNQTDQIVANKNLKYENDQMQTELQTCSEQVKKDLQRIQGFTMIEMEHDASLAGELQ